MTYKCNICGIPWDEHNNPNHPIEGRELTDHYFSGDELSDDGIEFKGTKLIYFN